MGIPRIYVDEPCALDGYDSLSVRVLANSTEAEWRLWATGNLGTPDCAECAKLPAKTREDKEEEELGPLRAPSRPSREYCAACTAARAAFGQSIVTFYGPTLLEHDVSTEAAALALFDDDTALPGEIVIWLQLVPGVVRNRRQEALLGNLIPFSTTPS